jgi:hypothetical protein
LRQARQPLRQQPLRTIKQKMVEKIKKLQNWIQKNNIYIFFSISQPIQTAAPYTMTPKTKSTTIYILIKIDYLGKPKHKKRALPH